MLRVKNGEFVSSAVPGLNDCSGLFGSINLIAHVFITGGLYIRMEPAKNPFIEPMTLNPETPENLQQKPKSNETSSRPFDFVQLLTEAKQSPISGQRQPGAQKEAPKEAQKDADPNSPKKPGLGIEFGDRPAAVRPRDLPDFGRDGSGGFPVPRGWDRTTEPLRFGLKATH
jgi:hypothetical protein